MLKLVILILNTQQPFHKSSLRIKRAALIFHSIFFFGWMLSDRGLTYQPFGTFPPPQDICGSVAANNDIFT